MATASGTSRHSDGQDRSSLTVQIYGPSGVSFWSDEEVRFPRWAPLVDTLATEKPGRQDLAERLELLLREDPPRPAWARACRSAAARTPELDGGGLGRRACRPRRGGRTWP